MYFFNQSIGPSEIIKNYYGSGYFLTTLKAKKIFNFELNENNIKIVDEIDLGQRIRDIVYDDDLKIYFLFLENMPSISLLLNKENEVN